MTVELQDVFQKHYPAYAASHDVPFGQAKAAQAIIDCRTNAYGGRVEQCPNCDHTQVLYNSCRNRFCPKCQTIAKERWIDARREDLLPVPYYHVIFTLPDSLRVPVMQNQKVLYKILFDAVARTLQQLAADPKYLGVQLGFTSILHTWGQNLVFHPHIHCLIPSGGLTPYGTFKAAAHKEFFLPVAVISTVFRREFMALFQQAFDEGQLKFHGHISSLNRIARFGPFRHRLYSKAWVVFVRHAFSGPEAVIEYLGRYTHRTAISNNRILKLENGMVTFSWLDYRDGNNKTMVLPAEEFIRRILRHVLPCHFMRIRHYGLLANRNRNTKLRRCQQLAGQIQSKARFKDLSTVEILTIILGRDVTLCPHCGEARMVSRLRIPSGHSPPLSA